MLGMGLGASDFFFLSPALLCQCGLPVLGVAAGPSLGAIFLGLSWHTIVFCAAVMKCVMLLM